MSDFTSLEENIHLYELTYNKNLKQDEAELGYRDMNANFLDLEETHYRSDENLNWETRKQEHETRKKAIEDKWHKSTAKRAAEITREAKGSDKKKEYYSNFNLKDMEVLIKNSDRGGNSQEYNTVATELELYNRIMEDPDSYKNEAMEVLLRIRDASAQYLLTRKSPLTPKGKRRRAMMESINERITLLCNQETERYKNEAKTATEALTENATEETINVAVAANYNLMYHVLKGNITLDQGENANGQEKKQLDKNMKLAIDKLKDVKVDEDQNDNIATRFFNAIGWASHLPRKVESPNFEAELEKSPVKMPAYHCDNHIMPSEKMLKEDPKLAKKWEDRKDARWMGEQFAGMNQSRHYLSNGQTGKGTYLGVPVPGKTEEETKNNEKRTKKHLWSNYGSAPGSCQLTMCYNEHARILKKSRYFNLKDILQREFPMASDAIGNSETDTVFVSFFGYNTINVMSGGGDFNSPYCIYYVTSDRKALTLSSKVYTMTENCIQNDYDPDEAESAGDLF